MAEGALVIDEMTPAAYEARILYACNLVDHLKVIEPGKLTAEQRDRLRWAIGELDELTKWGAAFVASSKLIERVK